MIGRLREAAELGSLRCEASCGAPRAADQETGTGSLRCVAPRGATRAADRHANYQGQAVDSGEATQVERAAHQEREEMMLDMGSLHSLKGKETSQ